MILRMKELRAHNQQDSLRMAKRVVLITLFVMAFVLSAGMAWAVTLGSDHNRPEPFMDYVPQEIGIGDYDYASLEEVDCRSCHGTNVAKRHHYSKSALTHGLCTPCHAVKDTPPYVDTVPGCTASGCHSINDLGSMDTEGTSPNGWHHTNSLSNNYKCAACHDSDLIDHRADDIYVSPDPPPTVIVPSVYNCENCHWEQPLVTNTTSTGWTNGDPQANNPYAQGEMAGAGHPSTFDHNDASAGYSVEGSSAGPWNDYYEYGRAIDNNADTHHKFWMSDITANCNKCHPPDSDLTWDLIRYCQTCHNIETLHSIEPHMGTSSVPAAVNGWQAVGFHVPDTTNTDTSDAAPTTYMASTTNEHCYSCHGEFVPGYLPPEFLPSVSKITDITPTVGNYGRTVTLTGHRFGSPGSLDQSVRVKSSSGEGWSGATILSWSDTEIGFTLPSETFAIGNYQVSVRTEFGDSNVVPFTLTSTEENLSISPLTGNCREIITVSGQSIPVQDSIDAGSGEGVYRAVQVVGPSGTYVAATYGTWGETDFKFQLGDLFEDTDANYLRGPDEALNRLCEGFSVGEYLVYIKDIHYQDVDGSLDYGEGDQIVAVETSGPVSFGLESGPAVYAVVPQSVERSHYCPDGTLINGIAKIYGWGFGTSQGGSKVYIGTGAMYLSDTGLALNRVVWSNHVIKVGIDVPPGARDKTLYLWVEKDGRKTDDAYGWPGIYVLSTEMCP